MRNHLFIILFVFGSCNSNSNAVVSQPLRYDQSSEIKALAQHRSPKMRFKLIQSRIMDKNILWDGIRRQLGDFSEKDYLSLKPIILEQNIHALQASIDAGTLTYKKLTQWFLYRIMKYEANNQTYLNNIISINPNAVSEAQSRDENKSSNDHPIYGMPVLLKDNINFEGLPTTAGAEALKNNRASNAFIIDRIIDKGGIVLGKANLSEWANFLCVGCPNGYSAIGGQTLNPYGRKIHDTGGSSSGSGSGIAANYAVAAVGTETSGSILSPASANSIVGLKPTTGLLSRSGIVPLSGTLDTPGPMTKNVIDNAIFLSALIGLDEDDSAMMKSYTDEKYWEEVTNGNLRGIRFGVNVDLLEDSMYKLNVELINSLGGVMIEFTPIDMKFEGFLELLSADMKLDLPIYLGMHADSNLGFTDLEEIVEYNQVNPELKIPYGQGQFEAILKTNISESELIQIKEKIHTAGVAFFESAMSKNKLDVILSMNNWNAGHAAAANYPCLTVPMGYRASGEPVGLTFIGKPYTETNLLKLGYAFEQHAKARKLPDGFQ